MYADFRLPERYQGKLRVRQSVQLQLDAFPGRLFKANVEAIDPLLDVNGRSVGVRAVLPNTMGEPLPQAGGRPGGPGGAAAAAPGGKPGQAVNASAAGKPAGQGAASRGADTAGNKSRVAGGTQQRGAAAGQPEGGRVAGRRLAADAVGCVSTDDVALVNDGGRQGVAAVPGAATSASGTTRGPADAPATRGQGGAARPAPLRPGMFARVTIVFAIKEAAIVVPEEAIVPQGGRQFVIKVVEPAQSATGEQKLPPDTKFVSLRQEVKLGARQQGRVEVIEGLAEGETVVVAGQQRLARDGTALRIVDLGRPAPRGTGGAPATASATASDAMAPLAAASK
jgi:multidrug efflux pump subunit AcrA (membrane-fusion protein)